MTYRNYFDGLSASLTAEAKSASVPGHRGDTGHNRELLAREFFSKHLPKRLVSRLGGVVFGSDGSQSKQQDVLIVHDMSMAFDKHDKVNVPVESLAAVVSVKSMLNSQSIPDALAGLATIPQCDQSVISFGPLTKPVTEYVQSWPSLFLFSFDGPSMETCWRHVEEFYQNNPTPQNRRPRSIVVNGKYAINFHHYETKIGGGTGTRRPWSAFRCNADTTGAPLFSMALEISKAVTWLNSMTLNFRPYFLSSYPLEKLETQLDVAKFLGEERIIELLAKRVERQREANNTSGEPPIQDDSDANPS